MKILLIEDSFFWQKTIQNSLEEAHLPNAHLVSSIHEASDYLAFNTPDLIISDILVSKKIVYELFQLEKLKSIPTIFITSSDDEFLYEKKKA
jgi:two-component SAPR family response regulator